MTNDTPQEHADDATTAGTRAPLPPAPITRTNNQPVTAPILIDAAIPKPAPVAGPLPPPAAPAQGASSRGLYISLGAVIVLVALVLAGLYAPKGKRGSVAAEPAATKRPQSAATQPTPEATARSSASATKPVEAEPVLVGVKPAPSRKEFTAKNPGDRLSGSDQAAAAEAAAAKAQAEEKARAEELDRIEHDVDQLTGRAASVNSSVQNLQRQQAAMGLGLRGDISERLSSMKVNLAKAQEAIARQDAVHARRYADLAGSDVEALEKFLGR